MVTKSGTTLFSAAVLAALGVAAAGAPAAHASVIIANPVAFSTASPGVNLSAGASDWAEFGGNGTQNGLQAPAGTNFTQATSTDGGTAFGTWGTSAGYPIFTYTLGSSTVTNDGYFVESPHNGQNNLTFDLNVAAGASETVDVYAGYYGFNNLYNASQNYVNYQLTATLGTDTVANQTPLPMVVQSGSYYAGMYAITVDNTSANAETLAVNAQSNPSETFYNNFFGASVTPASSPSVPEGSTLGLVGIGGLGLLLLKRKGKALA